MNYFYTLEQILFANNPKTKVSRFKNFYDNFLSRKVIFEENFVAKVQNQPSYYDFCKIVHPTRIRRPKLLNSEIALAKIIHSIAHIEYSAIDLALDASYRFANLPLQYYKDWLEVANEEIEHFLLMESVLNELGFQYGDFPVHQNLFDAMQATNHSLSHRMGLVHRALEANGLDANPFVLQKIHQSTHSAKNKIIEALNIILNDEITHVGKGNIWWNYSKHKDEDFFKLLTHYKHLLSTSKVLNTEARIKAGYTLQELEFLKQNYAS
ncbi:MULTISPECIES: ferritin-like domain-containing protein [unclassified Helicobacter]|uniref:ferritin-like domain-containing protein n=1 Tax=unclassified Helicobacter TaxID=2593540 RepID=UPI000CF1C40A|nr:MULTISPECIES: ferritin-like domain-containing protein [unclassified Helicobacter]